MGGGFEVEGERSNSRAPDPPSQASLQTGFYSNLFLVPKKAHGSAQPVINLRALNQFVLTEHFKMEGIHMLRDLFRQGDWLTKVNLKDAYFSIPIAPGTRGTFVLRCRTIASHSPASPLYTTDLYQDPKTSDGPTQRGEANPVSGRFPHIGRFPEISERAH